MISYSGFSEDELNAFGRGKRVICMDGLDIYEMLSRELPLPHVLERKVRRAARLDRGGITGSIHRLHNRHALCRRPAQGSPVSRKPRPRHRACSSA